jgi:hypothetical protein
MATERADVDGIGRSEVEKQIGGHGSGRRYQIRGYDDRGRLAAGGAEQSGPQGKHSHQPAVGASASLVRRKRITHCGHLPLGVHA